MYKKVIITSLFFLSLASAETKIVGMTQYDVLSDFGAPVEKIEMESARKEVWVYQKNKFRFEDGFVSAHKTRGNENTGADSRNFKPKFKQDASSEVEVNELLSELKAADRGETGKTPTPAGASLSSNQPIIPPVGGEAVTQIIE